MPVHDQTGDKFGVEVRAPGREQNARAGIAFDCVDVGQRAWTRSCAQRWCSDLNGREVPAGGVAVMSIGEEKRLRREGMLHEMDAPGIADAPDLVQASEPVFEFDESAFLRFEQRPEQALQIAAPQPEAARVGFSGMHCSGARGDSIGAGLFMGEDDGVASIEQPHDSGAYRFASIARKAETLVVDEQGGAGIPDSCGAAEASRRFFAWHVHEARKLFGWHGKTIGVEGKKNWHLTEARITGAAQ
jgi:hypothetical protein